MNKLALTMMIFLTLIININTSPNMNEELTQLGHEIYRRFKLPSLKNPSYFYRCHAFLVDEEGEEQLIGNGAQCETDKDGYGDVCRLVNMLCGNNPVSRTENLAFNSIDWQASLSKDLPFEKILTDTICQRPIFVVRVNRTANK